jgi:hypothetical protein
MLWVIGYVAVAMAGLVVLGAAGWRLWGDVRELSRAVSAASQRISDAVAELDEATATAPPGRLRPGGDDRALR